MLSCCLVVSASTVWNSSTNRRAASSAFISSTARIIPEMVWNEDCNAWLSISSGLKMHSDIFSARSVDTLLNCICRPAALAASGLPGATSFSKHSITDLYCANSDSTALTQTSHRVGQSGHWLDLLYTGLFSDSSSSLNIVRAISDWENNKPSLCTTCNASSTAGASEWAVS